MNKANLGFSFHLLLSSLFVVVLSNQDVTSTNGVTEKTMAHASLHSSIESDVKTYLDALERFDRSKDSCNTLTAAIANFLKSIRLGVTRRHELASLLFAYAKLRPKVFTEVQDERTFRDPKKTPNANTLHAFVLRNDGTVFLFCVGSDIVSVLDYMTIRSVNGGKSYRWIRGDVEHTVGVRLAWKKQKGRRVTLYAEYLCDVYKYDQAINVTSEISLK